jgi:hypothetical protein
MNVRLLKLNPLIFSINVDEREREREMGVKIGKMSDGWGLYRKNANAED